MWNPVKLNQKNQILNQLVSENCLSFGRNPKLNNKKITHYISGTRQKIDIFNFYEMRYLLLRVYPLIHNLFLQQRLNVTKKKKKFFLNKNLFLQSSLQKLPKQFKNWENFRKFQTKFHKSLRGALRPFLPQILFATTTELYSSIVSSAAKQCHMPFHVNRWLSGTITAAASYLEDVKKWSFLTNEFHKKIEGTIQEKFFKRKKNIAQQKNKIRKYQLGRKPSLIIIPDVFNNEMIIKETNVFGIPVLGLLNSNCHVEIAYPIFANDVSIFSVHFFCHFLSSLIKKEVLKNKHKLYLTPKRKVSLSLSQFQKEIHLFNKKILKLQFFRKKKKKSKKKEYVFQGRYFLENLIKPQIKIKKELRYVMKKSFLYKMRKLRKKKKHKIFRAWKKKYKKKKLRILPKKYQEKELRIFLKKYKKKELRNPPKNYKEKELRITPKKLSRIENQKRFHGKKRNFYLKTKVLPKIKLLKRTHHFNFSKVWQEIRAPENKPRFRFWHAKKFFFSRALPFVTNTPCAFQFKRFVFPKMRRKQLQDLKQWNWVSRKRNKHKQRKKIFSVMFRKRKKTKEKHFQPYRKKWTVKKSKKKVKWENLKKKKIKKLN